jgi:hypothetical protein
MIVIARGRGFSLRLGRREKLAEWAWRPVPGVFDILRGALYTLTLQPRQSLCPRGPFPHKRPSLYYRPPLEKKNVPGPTVAGPGIPISDTRPLRLTAMDIFRHPQQSGSTAPSMRGPLGRSFPSSQSIASTVSPGTSTPNSWSANEWLRGSPNTSPPSSGVGSPELKAKLLAEDGRVSPVEESIDTRPVFAAKNICFVGAGFVGMSSLCLC